MPGLGGVAVVTSSGGLGVNDTGAFPPHPMDRRLRHLLEPLSSPLVCNAIGPRAPKECSGSVCDCWCNSGNHQPERFMALDTRDVGLPVLAPRGNPGRS